MSRRFVNFGVSCALWILLIHAGRNALYAQAVTGQISGTATDSSGAALPGVEVTLTQTDTGFKRSGTTDETGSYLFTNIPIGPYRLDATKPGFRSYTQTGIVLQVDSAPVIPIPMNVGQVTETIQVQVNASQVETRVMGVGSVVENQKILELPLNGRQVTDLINIAGAAVQTATSPAWAMRTGVNFSVGGGQTYGVAYLLDGAQHSNFYDATGMPLPFPDALQEFKVETSALTAQNGTHSAATISGVTKSGTNGFHGDLFEFLRNDDLNARNFFSSKRELLKRNQYGGTFGGPIKKDKIFFFFGYQGTTLRQKTSDATENVPTAQELSGDFTNFASARCQGTNRTLAAPFVNNQIGPAAFSPAAVKLASLLPRSNDPCGSIRVNLKLNEYDGQYVGRVDYQLSPKQTVFGRYMATQVHNDTPSDLSTDGPASLHGINALTTTAPPGSGFTIPVFSQNDLATDVTVGDTYLFNSGTVNSFRAAFNRVSGYHGGPSFFGPADLGIPQQNAFAYLPKTMNLSVTGGFAIGPGAGAYITPIDVTMLQLNNDVTWIRGQHQFAFGGQIAQSLVDGVAHVFSQGIWTFAGQATGLGMADFLLGKMTGPAANGYRQQTPNTLIEYQRFLGMYAQDTWKVTQHMTVNYGLRWEPYFPMQVKDERIFNFSQDRFNRGIASAVYPNAPLGFYYPGDQGFNGNASIEKQWQNFDPRIGFAWDPKGNGRMSIRGGVGISYDFINQQIHHNTSAATPWGGQLIIPTANFDNPYQGFSPAPFPYFSTPGNGRFQPFGSFQPVPPNLKTPEVYAWNLAVQRQMTQTWFLSASYLGNQAIHLLTATELNPPLLIPGLPILSGGAPCSVVPVIANCAANENYRRALYLQSPQADLTRNAGFITQYDSGATQRYNGLLLNTTFRPGRNLNVNANYTWSHCIGEFISTTTPPNPGQNYNHLNNRTLDRGNCGAQVANLDSVDQRHIFNLTAVAQMPAFQRKGIRTIGSGWTLSTIYQWRSGSYLNILSGIDNSLTGFANQRANQVNPNVFAATRGASCPLGGAAGACVSWLNLGAFTPVAQMTLGQLGNMGYYNVLGPSYWQFDSALSRDFRIREGHTLQVRGEAFNILNGVRFNNPNNTLAASTTFGKILSAKDPRIVQLAMKYVF
jgi:hypothetical protein